jgi:hypothetical protein
MERDGFDRKLEQLLVARLRAGQAPETLLEELKARLTPAEAEDVLARAEARVDKAGRGPRIPLAGHLLMGLVYVWIVMLIFQNIGVLFAIQEIPSLPGDPGHPTWIALALLKIGLLCGALPAFWRWRSAFSTAGLALAILYAWPVGRFVDGWLGFGFGPQSPSILVSGSALPSYVAVALVVIAYHLAQRAAPQPAPVEAFD